MSQQPASGNAPPQSGSKFRRTLSHGLAFISNPLSQRKTTPGRRPALSPTLAVTAPVTNASSPHCDAIISLMRDPTASKRLRLSPTGSSTFAHQESPTTTDGVNATPTALPQSRTTSFLPRPVRSAFDASVDDQDRTVKIQPVTIVTDPKLRAMQSKIPTPSPPLSERRISSPRQYLSPNTSRREIHVTVGHAVVGDNAGSPSKLAVRSRTTPNLAKASHSPQPAHYMAPNRAEYKRSTGTPVAPRPTLRENIPTNNRINQRRSQIQEKSLKRESLAVPALVTNRESLAQGDPLTYSKQPNRSTPLMAKKRLSSNLAQQTPVTAKRMHPKEREQEPMLRNDSSIAQSRLMGPRNPPSPTPLLAEIAGPHLPRSNTDKDLQRKTLGTPNGLGGIWRSSRALAAANHEVRLPRSFTFHNFGASMEGLPPVPAIPDQYRKPSLLSFFQPTSSHETYRYKVASTASSCEAIPNPTVDTDPGHAGRSTPAPLPDSSDGPVAQQSLPHHSSLPSSTTSTQSSTVPISGVQTTHNERPWSISDQNYEDSTDIEPYFQVRDYMPPLYWAGRFTSRLDHWRTEAMMAELDPECVPEGPLGGCKSSEDKLVSCHIFAQLRDLCLTEQAADSLWVRVIRSLPVLCHDVLTWCTGV
jgi:hypothetical protein